MRALARAALLGLGACLALGAEACAAPAASIWTAPAFELVQFRFPWENERKPARKPRRAKPEKARPARQKPGVKRRDQAPPSPPRRPALTDRRDAALPRAAGPATLAPRGGTRREQEDWSAVLAQVPQPPDPPLLPADGPAPAPANVLAVMMSRPSDAPTARPAPVATPPDAAVPLPPQRETGASEPGAADPPTALAPPLPPRRSDGGPDVPPQASLPPQPLEEAKPEPSAPALALPELAFADDPDCRALEADGVAEFTPAPSIEGPGVCGSRAPVELTGVRRRDGATIPIKPAATLRCAMARELAAYVRDDLAPAAEQAGDALVKVEIAGSFMCRGRNGAAGGKMSEHGRANAVDLSGLTLKTGGTFAIFAKDMPQALSGKAKDAACGRFDTVLGPGSDGHHESHLHLDLQPRKSKSKLCQWDEPKVADEDGGDEEPAAAKPAPGSEAPKPAASHPPLPLPRPAETP
jgi:hypothetical protein